MCSSQFHPVIYLPLDVDVLDLSTNEGLRRPRRSAFSIGRYNEPRVIYTQMLFAKSRNIHMGVDLGAPAGTPVHAFSGGTIAFLGVNPAEGDYGPTIITAHQLQNRPIWALHGHLSIDSLVGKRPGDTLKRGGVIGHLGDEQENGGWPPHVHFQLSWRAPTTHDMRGVFSAEEHTQALIDHPDPRIVLGAIY